MKNSEIVRPDQVWRLDDDPNEETGFYQIKNMENGYVSLWVVKSSLPDDHGNICEYPGAPRYSIEWFDNEKWTLMPRPRFYIKGLLE